MQVHASAQSKSKHQVEVLLRGLWRVRWAQAGVCPAVSERCNRGAAAMPLEGSVGPGRGVSGSFGAVR